MKKYLLLLTASLTLTVTQGQTWQWAKGAGGSADDAGMSISTDANGNSYVTGVFQSSSITFGTITLLNTGTGNGDIFIVKYDSLGNVLWAKGAGTTSNDAGMSISTDPTGNVFITGFFESVITFGTFTLSSAGNEDIFVVKYDSSGSILWAKSAGGTLDDEPNSIFTDTGGNALVTGKYRSPSITVGANTINNTNAGVDDFFLMKYDANGNILWLKSAGANSYDSGRGVCTDKTGNILVTGYYKDTITFGSTTLTNAGTRDIFIVKYDATGNVLWAKTAIGTASDDSYSIATDTSGNILVTGLFYSPSITFGTTTLTNVSTYSDFFIAKYSPNGNVLWARSAGGIYNEWGLSMTSDPSGNALITGLFDSPSFTFGTTTLTNATGGGEEDVFVVKYDTSGNVLWAKSAGGTSYDWGMGIATDANSNVWVTGFFMSSSINFGTTVLTNAGANLDDVFVVKLDSTSNTTGIVSLENNFAIYISPNPFSAKTTLQAAAPLQNASLTVYNSVGQTVKHIDNLSGQTIVFHRDNLLNGLYFVLLTQDGNTISADKFVIADE